MSATTIDEVVKGLEAILERSVATHDRRGYFAALYNRVTHRVRDGIQKGEFEDGDRMARLDVVFANRYLDAYAGYERGEPVSVAWKRAFDAALHPHDGLLVMQHLLLGMNAHITLDLGIAAATVAPGAAIDRLQGDFDRINTVLASLLGTVEDELVEIVGRWHAPLGATFRLAERVAHGRERSAASLLMTGARDAAWHFAKSLAPLDADAAPPRIRRHDEETTLLSDLLLLGPPGPRAADVAGNIRILAQGELSL
jgi:Family of unknown function (DUF5995)